MWRAQLISKQSGKIIATLPFNNFTSHLNIHDKVIYNKETWEIAKKIVNYDTEEIILLVF